MPTKIKVIQPLDKPAVAVEVMAEAIVSISQGVKKLLAGPLNEDCLVLLIQRAAPLYGDKYRKKHVGLEEIRAVLEGLADLEKTHLKAKKP